MKHFYKGKQVRKGINVMGGEPTQTTSDVI